MSKVIGYPMGNAIRIVYHPENASDDAISEYDELWIVASTMEQRIAELEAALNDAAQRAHAHAQYLGKKYHTGFSFRECTNECCQGCAELLKGGQDDNGA